MRRAAGVWLIVAATGFWISWLLMPGVGVTDPARIFELVGMHRPEVFASVVLQLVSAAAYLPGAIGLATADTSNRAIRIGSLLLALGAAGSAADAIFHLVAYEMTAPGTSVVAMTGVMARLQGPDLALLLPLIVAFFAGHIVLATSFRRRGPWGRLAFRLLLATPVLVAACGVAVRAGLAPKRTAGLLLLGLLSASLASAGAAAMADPSLGPANR